MLSIPLLNIQKQVLRVNLDGQNTQLTVAYQPSDRGWYMTLEYPIGTVLAAGRRLTERSYLGSPAGEFRGDFHVDGAGAYGPEMWGNTHHLVWTP